MNIKKIKSAELISFISHEIKNSLNPVINLPGIMLKNRYHKLSSDEREYLEVIERNGRKILSLVDHFSYLNRIKNGSVSRSYSPVSIRSVIENSVNAVSGCKTHCRIEPVCIFETGDIEPVLDPESFKRIISCITEFFLSIRNIDYLYFRISSGNGCISLNISERDTGEGISTDCMDGEEYPGTAALSETSLLWYSIAEELVSASGGTSGVGHGGGGEIIWFFSFPLSEVDRSSVCEDFNTDKGAGREFTMMVIDDDPDTMVPLRAIAEHEFGGLCRIVHAHTGSEGIDLLEKIKPDVILLDLTLPDINGFSLLRSIRNFFIEEHVPVIAFTGHDIGLNREKLISSGFDDIIIKPFDIDVFVEKIRNWIR